MDQLRCISFQLPDEQQGHWDYLFLAELECMRCRSTSAMIFLYRGLYRTVFEITNFIVVLMLNRDCLRTLFLDTDTLYKGNCCTVSGLACTDR